MPKHSPCAQARHPILFLFLFLAGGKYFSSAADPNTTPPDESKLQIVGGESANLADYPWMGALVNNIDGNNTQQFCGCTAIDPYWVMTAAHCLDRDIAIDEFKIVFGTADLDNFESAKVFYPKSVIFHPDFGSIYDSDYDIALIQLSTPLPESIIPVPLISSEEREQAGRTAKALGWGLTTNVVLEPEDTLLLQEADLPILSREFANQAEFYRDRVTDKMLAAGEFEPYRAVHSGDSGGPLIIFNAESDRWEQIGISSFAAGCNISNNPIGVFTRISSHKTWIDAIIENDFLHWLSQNDLNQLDYNDGDGYSPVTEWILGMDPYNPDVLDWSDKLQRDTATPSHTIFLPLKMRDAVPKIDFELLWSDDFSTWQEKDISWMNLQVEDHPRENFSIYKIPVAGEQDSTGFYRLGLVDKIGQTQGPFPLRLGSYALGNLGVDFVKGELTPPGQLRYDYRLEVLNASHPIRVSLEIFDEVNVRLRILNFDDGLTLVDNTSFQNPIQATFMPQDNTTYLLRIETEHWEIPNPFQLFVDYEYDLPYKTHSQTYYGRLTPEDAPYKRAGYYSERYRFQLSSNDTYKVEIRSNTLDPILVLKNPNTNRILQEVDEEPPGVAEEFLFRTGSNPIVEVIAGSWRFGETGDYQIEVTPYGEARTLRTGNNILGLIHLGDIADEQNGFTYYLDFINLEDINKPGGVTIGVWGVEEFRPTYAIYDKTAKKTLHQVRARCSNTRYHLIPEEGHLYDLVIIARDRDLGDNYRLSIVEGNATNTVESEEFDRLLKPQQTVLNNLPTEEFDLPLFYRSRANDEEFHNMNFGQ